MKTINTHYAKVLLIIVLPMLSLMAYGDPIIGPYTSKWTKPQNDPISGPHTRGDSVPGNSNSSSSGNSNSSSSGNSNSSETPTPNGEDVDSTGSESSESSEYNAIMDGESSLIRPYRPLFVLNFQAIREFIDLNGYSDEGLKPIKIGAKDEDSYHFLSKFFGSDKYYKKFREDAKASNIVDLYYAFAASHFPISELGDSTTLNFGHAKDLNLSKRLEGNFKEVIRDNADSFKNNTQYRSFGIQELATKGYISARKSDITVLLNSIEYYNKAAEAALKVHKKNELAGDKCYKSGEKKIKEVKKKIDALKKGIASEKAANQALSILNTLKTSNSSCADYVKLSKEILGYISTPHNLYKNFVRTYQYINGGMIFGGEGGGVRVGTHTHV